MISEQERYDVKGMASCSSLHLCCSSALHSRTNLTYPAYGTGEEEMMTERILWGSFSCLGQLLNPSGFTNKGRFMTAFCFCVNHRKILENIYG